MILQGVCGILSLMSRLVHTNRIEQQLDIELTERIKKIQFFSNLKI